MFKELIFENAYAVFNRVTKRVETQGFKIYIDNNNVFEFTSEHPGSCSKSDGEPESIRYLESFIRKIILENKTNKALVPSIDDIGLPFRTAPEKVPDWFKDLRSKSAILIVSNVLFDIDPGKFPFDLAILNNPADHIGSRGGEFKFCRINDHFIEVKGIPAKTVRILHDIGIHVKCFVGLGDGCGTLDYSNCTHLAEFFALLSPVLSDESLYITDHDFWLDRSLIRQYSSTNNGFPVMHFMAKEINPEDLPFDVGVFPVSPPFEWLLFDPTPPNFLRTYKLKRLPPDTETYSIGKTEVSLSNSSVWDFQDQFDCIIPNSTDRKSMEAYLPLKKEREYIVNTSWFINRSIDLFLEEAFLEKWRTVGIGFELDSMMILRFLKALKRWKKDFPLTIHFFVLNPKRKSEISMLLKRYNLKP